MIVVISFILIFLILLKIPIIREVAAIGLVVAILVFVFAVGNRAMEISNEKQKMEYRR